MVSETFPLATMEPSRRTVYLSHMSMTSRSLWEINTIATPWSFRVRIMSKTRSISGSVREVVGSSIMIIDASIRRARAISTICL